MTPTDAAEPRHDPTPSPSSGRLRGWAHWYRRALPAYWLFLFALTHFPKLSLSGPVERPDLYSHFIAFGLLAFLLWRFGETFRRPLGSGFVWIAGAVILAYGAFDELTQELVGRDATIEDWLANACGATLVLAALEVNRRGGWRRLRRRLGPGGGDGANAGAGANVSPPPPPG
ncbi:MAG: VanZ family protein [Phycisphaerae bacterium]|nr:VanZ family protein [Phycisphaerae bacterium]MCZ2401279.1 VanZ family protein [Phycisphaerae bacterium]